MKPFTFLPSYYEALKGKSAEVRLAVYDAICKYCFEGIKPDFKSLKFRFDKSLEICETIWILISPVLQSSTKASTKASTETYTHPSTKPSTHPYTHPLTEPSTSTRARVKEKEKDMEKEREKDIPSSMSSYLKEKKKSSSDLFTELRNRVVSSGRRIGTLADRDTFKDYIQPLIDEDYDKTLADFRSALSVTDGTFTMPGLTLTFPRQRPGHNFLNGRPTPKTPQFPKDFSREELFKTFVL